MTDFKLGQTVWWFSEFHGEWKLNCGEIYELKQEIIRVFRTQLKIIFLDYGYIYSHNAFSSKEEAIEAMRKWLDGL